MLCFHLLRFAQKIFNAKIWIFDRLLTEFPRFFSDKTVSRSKISDSCLLKPFLIKLHYNSFEQILISNSMKRKLSERLCHANQVNLLLSRSINNIFYKEESQSKKETEISEFKQTVNELHNLYFSQEIPPPKK